MHRRDFINSLSKLAAVGFLAKSLFAKTAVAASPRLLVDLTKKEYQVLGANNGAMLLQSPLDSSPIMLIRTSPNSFAALSARCTHKGCKLVLPKEGAISCPCHDAKFDLFGKVTQGPAKKALQKFRTEFKGSLVTVYFDKADAAGPADKY